MSIQLLFFLIQLALIFIISRFTINQIFYFLRIFIKEDKMCFYLVSLFFLPGTIVHEFGHFFAAAGLMLRVRDIKIFPEIEGNEIKLGKVLYEKKDFVRGVLVGVAPVFTGLLVFWMFSGFKLFPNQNILLNILLIYVIFAISSTMFSSKQDLVDLIYILPLFLIIGALIYIFDLRFDWILNNPLIRENLMNFFKQINFYLLFSIIINVIMIVSLKTIRLILRK